MSPSPKTLIAVFLLTAVLAHGANAEFVDPFDIDVENNPHDITRLTCAEFVGISKGKYDGNAKMLMFPILAWVHGWSVGVSGEARPFNKEFLVGMSALLGAKCEANPQMTVLETLKSIVKK